MKLFIMTLLSSIFAMAATPTTKYAKKDPCAVAQIKAVEFELISENISNVNTTSDLRGSPYQRKTLKCKNGDCDVVAENKTVRKYMPDHDDADIDGYVEFPAIDVKKEMTALLKVSEELGAAKARCQ